jgi:hypothetical protein
MKQLHQIIVASGWDRCRETRGNIRSCYFLLQVSIHCQTDLDTGAILQHVQRKVSVEMNVSLVKPYTAEEVKKGIL